MTTFVAASKFDPQILRIALSFYRRGQYTEAERYYRIVLAADGTNLPALAGLGDILTDTDRPAEAIPLLEKALARMPDSADAHSTIARAYDLVDRMDEAVAHFEKSLTLRPADQRTLAEFRATLVRLDRSEELTLWIEKALAAEPDSMMLNGMLAAQFYGHGRLDDAVRATVRTIELDPKSTEPYAFLAEIKRFKQQDPHLALIENKTRGGEALSTQQRLSLQFALGKAYADIGRHEEAFRELASANRLMRSTLTYDVSETEAELKLLPEIFSPALLREKAGLGDPSERPLFIVGMMRSGSTLLEQILSSHPDVFGGGERSDVRRAMSRTIRAFPYDVPGLGARELRAIGESYLNLTKITAPNAKRFVDKTLINDVMAGFLHMIFPRARIIHVERNALDTCMSTYSLNLGSRHPYTFDLSELGRYCRAQRDLMAYWEQVLPSDVFLKVRYEDVVSDLERQARRIYEFCGLSWDPSCLAFEKNKRPVWTASAAQIRRPLFTDSVGRWKPDAETLRPLLEALGPYAAKS